MHLGSKILGCTKEPRGEILTELRENAKRFSINILLYHIGTSLVRHAIRLRVLYAARFVELGLQCYRVTSVADVLCISEWGISISAVMSADSVECKLMKQYTIWPPLAIFNLGYSRVAHHSRQLLELFRSGVILVRLLHHRVRQLPHQHTSGFTICALQQHVVRML